MSGPSSAVGRWVRFFASTVPLLAVLLTAVLLGAGEKIHNVLLQMGESRWEQYALLRVDPEKPDCNPEGPAPAEKPTEAEEDDLFGDPDTSDEASIAAAKECKDRHAAYAALTARITDDVRSFRSKEQFVSKFVEWGIGHARHLLVLIILIGGITATFFRHHIGLRAALTVMEDRVSQLTQLVANGLLLTSFFALKKVYSDTGESGEGGALLQLWIAGFATMSAANIWHLVRPAPSLARTGGTLNTASLSVPLYASMTLVCSAYFVMSEGGHWPGVAIYLQALLDNAILYIQVALYLWVGMLLKNTRLAELIFDVLRPWNLPPHILAVLVVVGAAVPTAFTGASGIFVIATGAIVYSELIRSGAHRQLAFAATAMSGSMGVVLKPCLLVVIVAAMNYKEVTTDQLFEMGRYVFALSATVFTIAALILFFRSDAKFVKPNVGAAARGSVRALLRLVPYVAIGIAVWATYRYMLDTKMDEHSAPAILPVMMIAIVIFDRLAARYSASKAGDDVSTVRGVGKSLADSTGEAAGHIGGLLAIMGLSICVGAVIERSDIMALFPQQFGSPFTAMLLLVVIKVIVGMIMDPYGAVILVSQTLAPIAYKNGIHPVHFWMMVLTAFELGYLLPPVALNRILTRQVIGEAEYQLMKAEGTTFWERHEGTLLPLGVMAVVLVLVAFVPLWF